MVIVLALLGAGAAWAVDLAATPGSADGGRDVSLLPTPPPTHPGDVDCSGAPNAIDAAIILQREAGRIASLPCPQNGDVNGDGDADAIDAALVLQAAAGLADLPPPTEGGLAVRNVTHVQEDGLVRVYGEVHALLPYAYFSALEMTATLVAADGTPLASGTAFACVGTIASSGDSPFEVVVEDAPAMFDRVRVVVSSFFVTDGAIPPPTPGNVAIGPNHKSVEITQTFTDAAGRHLVGEVTNTREQSTFVSLRICAASYDADGNLVSTGVAPPSPGTLGPGETATFEVVLDIPAGVAIASDRTWVDGRLQQ
jgi:hypothetical protein